MRTLEFQVNQQQLKKKPGCDFSGIVSGTSGYLRAVFHFSEEWDGCRKVASFYSVEGTEFAVLLDENESCEVHEGALDGAFFEITVTGAKKTEDGQVMKITTDKMKVRQEVR